MAEFLPHERQDQPKVLVYTFVIFVVIAGGVFLFARFQASRKLPGVGMPVVPGVVRPGDPNFEYYKSYVRISDVKATLGINFAKSRIAIISGVITNDGDRKLEVVEFRIALYDLYDKLSKERISMPLRPGVGINRPMEPLEKREFTVWIEPIEQLWNPKRMEIEITGLKYH